MSDDSITSILSEEIRKEIDAQIMRDFMNAFYLEYIIENLTYVVAMQYTSPSINVDSWRHQIIENALITGTPLSPPEPDNLIKKNNANISIVFLIKKADGKIATESVAYVMPETNLTTSGKERHNRILGVIEDFTNMPIDEYTHGTFTFYEL